MTSTERQGMIDALLLDDLRMIEADLKENDPTYLLFLLEERTPYTGWTNREIEEAYNELKGTK